MATITIIGPGRLGSAVARAGHERGDTVALVGRPSSGRHEPAALGGTQVVVDASLGPAVASNVAAAVEGGARRIVVAATGWDADRPRVQALLHEFGAAAVVAPNFSLGTALFGRLVERAGELFGAVDAFDPFIVEWHRRGKADRPSATARALAERLVTAQRRDEAPEIVSVRAGSSPGMHLVGFDAPGETVELRITARDRVAYAAGILASADWLLAAPREPGIHTFDDVVDDLLASRTPVAA